MNPIPAGLIAGIPLALILALYVLVRAKALVAFFKDQSPEIAKINDRGLLFIFLGGFIGAAFLFGVLSGLVYSWAGNQTYRYIALGSAFLFSILALISKTPLLWDKIFWNFAVGLVLGLLVPLLAI